MHIKEQYGWRRSVLALLFGAIASWLLLLCGSGILAAVLVLTPLSEAKIPAFALLILALALLGGGWVAARGGGTKGLYHGAALGVGWVLGATICTAAAGDIVWSIWGLKTIIVLLAAALGGILGVKN